jgi:EAL domain-containing protein (putative c-di-GMP-specific phosphodiesterase class I)
VTRSAQDLLRCADVAMYEAKRRGGGSAHVYRGDSGVRAYDLALEATLRRALPDQLRAVYQPRVRLEDGTPVGAEALMRWEHPERGLVGPGDFIPVAEQSGLIVPMGRWILHEACAEAMRWNASPLQVSVNISARQVADRSLVSDVREALETTGLAPERLELELTETLLMEDREENVAVMRGLRELGVSLVLDDFGTGWSSLGYLTRFPIDAIKLDRSFVAAMGHDTRVAAIVDAVIGLAERLEIDIVAEGIETGVQRDEVMAAGCSLAQGYYFGAPGPAARVG